MVGGVPFALAAGVLAFIAGLRRSEAAQSVRCEQRVGADIDDGFLLRHRERAEGKRYRKNLVGAQKWIVTAGRNLNYVVTTVAIGIPKLLKIFPGFFGETSVAVRGAIEQQGKIGHASKRIDPQGVDLDGFAGSRSDDPVADLGVHPG